MQDEGKEPPEESQTEISGGVDIEAGRDVQVAGDVVGRDKVTVERGGIHVGTVERLTHVNIPRAIQIGIVIAVLAIVALAVVLIANQPAPVSVNTHFVFDASEAMADPERLQIAQSVLGDQATFATRREQLGLRIAAGGCEVPRDPDVPLGADQADRIVEAVDGVQLGGEVALVESIRAAADDLPPDPQGQNTNTIIVISAGQDMCLAKQNRDPCQAMASVAQSLERANIDFQLEIVALKPDGQTRQQLTCLVHANVNGRFHEANSVNDLRAILQEIEPAEAVPGVQNGSFESGDVTAWIGEGIEVVAVENTGTPDVGQYAAQMKPGQALEQSARVPGVGQPQLTVWYRAPGGKASGVLKIYVNDQLEHTEDNLAEPTGKRVAAEAPDWFVAVFNAEGFAGQEVTLRIEYAEAASRAGSVLRFPARQVDGVLWVDNVAFVAVQSLPAMVETAPTLSATPPPGPDASPTPTPARAATVTPTPRASATATRTRTPTAQPLTFTWRAGAFRESGRNDRGVGIWAQEIFVEARGGVPPYTILFDNVPKTTAPFQVFGLYCIGQVGTITVRSADGQTASQRVTIPAPLCPTNTPSAPPSIPNPLTPEPEGTVVITNDCAGVAFEWEPVPESGVTYALQVRSSDLILVADVAGIGATTSTAELCVDFYEWRVQAVRASDGLAGSWSDWIPFDVRISGLR